MHAASRIARALESIHRQRRVWLGVAGALLALLAAGAIAFAPLVRARVAALAERRGLEIRVESVRPSWRGVWLLGVDVRAAKLPGVHVQVAALRARLGWDLSLRALAVHGAQLSLQGTPDALLEQWRALNDESAPEPARQASSELDADGVDLVWERATSDGRTQRVWGLRYGRRAGREELGAELIRFERQGLKLEARRLRAQVVSSPVRVLDALTADAVDLDLNEPEREAKDKSSPALDAVAARGPELRALLSVAGGVLKRALPVRRAFTLHGISLHLRRSGESLNLGPSELTLLRDDATLSASLAPPVEAGGTPLELHATLPLGEGEARVEARGGPVSLASLGVREGDFGLIGVKRARLEVKGELALSADGSLVAFSGTGVAQDIALLRRELSPKPISGIRLAFRGHGKVTVDGRELSVEDGDFSIGDVHVQVSGSLTRRASALAGHLALALPLASCQSLLEAVPRGLAPLIAPLHMTGTLAANGALDYDSVHPLTTRVRLDVTNDCRIDQMSAEVSPRRFATVFQREVKGADRLPMRIESGPGSASWVPYEDISPFMETAVLVCEDGHFLRHHGFDYEAIGNAIRENLIAGRFARGASTISMQLAKNLYLDSGKTLGRKVQEAALTLLLEQELDKRALMELYLNVIEYGPGIYGIGPAAEYYFAKKPRDLSLGQALYIASILPNPDHQHFLPDGRISDAWAKYLQRLMQIARKIQRISPEQLEIGLNEQIAFRVADSGAPNASSDKPADDEANDELPAPAEGL